MINIHRYGVPVHQNTFDCHRDYALFKYRHNELPISKIYKSDIIITQNDYNLCANSEAGDEFSYLSKLPCCQKCSLLKNGREISSCLFIQISLVVANNTFTHKRTTKTTTMFNNCWLVLVSDLRMSLVILLYFWLDYYCTV